MTSKKDLSPSYSSIRDVIRRTYHNEGFFAFYRGLGTNMVRVAPGASLTLLVYERMSVSFVFGCCMLLSDIGADSALTDSPST